MRNLKKILSLVLAMMMVLSLMVTASAATFADDEDIDYKEAVEVMSAIGVLNGVKNADGTYDFLPKDTLNRAAGAKIVAYIANGGNLDPQVMDTLENPFTDVSGWAVDSVKYCYNEGIINGIGGGLFDPKNSLDGYAFGKMMLEAAGYDWQSANGSNWKTKVLMTLKANGLLTGIEDLVFSQPMTREQACQMAWNVMQKAPGAATAAPVYTVTVSGKTYEFATAAEAYFFAQGQTPVATVEVKDNSVSAGSLAAEKFGLSSSTTADVYGRTTKTWTSSKIDTLNVVLSDAVASYTFTVKTAATVTNSATLMTAVNTALGLTGDKALTWTSGTSKQVVNGVSDAPANLGTAVASLGVGDTVEVYASSTGVVSKVIVIREKAEVAVLGAEITTGANKGLYNWTFGTATTVAAKDAYTAGAYYVVVENGTTNVALDIKVPTVVKGAKITSADNAAIASATYVTINGDKVYKAGAYDHNVTTDSNTVVFNKAYDFILDSKGNVLFVTAAAAAVVEDPLETGYAYLLGAEKKVTTTAASSGGLLGDDVAYSWDIAAKAKLAMANGTTQVVDLTTEVTRNALGVVTALKLNGQAVKNVEIANDAAAVDLMGTSNLFNGVTWVQYTIQKDGTYTLAGVSTSSIALAQHVATVDGKTATSATTWTVYNYDPYTGTVSTTAVTGIANFVTDTYDSVYATSATNADVITGIVSFTNVSSEPVSAVTTYAYYVGQGDFDGTANAYAQKFYINGEVKEYFTTAAVTVATAADNQLEVGKVYALTIDTTGKVSAATYKAFNGSGEVTVVDNTFAVIGGNTLYFSANCKVFNVSTGHVGEADTLSTKVTAAGSGDVVSYVTVTVSGATYVDVIYITTEAN